MDFLARDGACYERVAVRRRVPDRAVVRRAPALRPVVVRRLAALTVFRVRAAARLPRALTLALVPRVRVEAFRVTRSPRFSAASIAFAARFRTSASELVTSSKASFNRSIAASTVPTAAYVISLV
ncbi:MAG TPA: hypothetical protein VJ922_09130 [Actinomycetota bacterium]|nr:hypothetical protein [Actinomycetota bacterium]